MGAKAPLWCLSHLATGDIGFPTPMCRYCGCHKLFLVTFRPTECRVLRLNVTECTALVQTSSRWSDGLSTMGMQTAVFHPSKSQSVKVAQFRSLPKLSLTTGNCFSYVCFRDKPCFCSFIEYWGVSEATCFARHALILWFWSCAWQAF